MVLDLVDVSTIATMAAAVSPSRQPCQTVTPIAAAAATHRAADPDGQPRVLGEPGRGAGAGHGQGSPVRRRSRLPWLARVTHLSGAVPRTRWPGRSLYRPRAIA